MGLPKLGCEGQVEEMPLVLFGFFFGVLTALTCWCVQANERVGATVALRTASTWSDEQEKRE